MNLAWRIYRRLAQAFPHEFKLAYGAEVTQLGKDVVEDLSKRRGAARLLTRLIADIAVHVPLEYLSEMRRDLRYAWRALIKSPGFALVGITSMGLGIGLTTNMYSSKWTLLFRDLPAAANAKRLVMPLHPVSYYYVEQYREQQSLFAGVAALQIRVPFNVTLPGDPTAKPERTFGQLVSPDYFSVLGVPPQHGRVLDVAFDRPGDAPSVVISDRFWRNRLGASPNAVGQTLRLNGQIATIVGITPRNFHGAVAETPSDLFVPITAPAALAPELANDVLHQRQAKEFLAIMCLAPGVTIDSAEAGLDAVTRRLDEEDPSLPRRTDNARRVTLLPAGATVPIPRELRPALAGFFGALMGLVTILACTNLANLLIARGANRRKELAIRLAVGASRFRLVRQMMTEGILLSLLGGVAGFGLAYGLSVLNAQVSLSMAAPVESDFSPDWHAAVFAFVLAIACGIGFSVAPALQAFGVMPPLKESSTPHLPGYRSLGLRNLLMVAQVAGSLMLLLLTGFLVMGISKVSRTRAEFDPARMYLLSLDPVRDGYTAEKAQALFDRLPDRLKAADPERIIALAAQAPFSIVGEDDGTQMTVDDPRETSRVQQSVIQETVGAGYFAALSEPMLAGREFEAREQRGQADGSKTSLPLVLNEAAARKFFGNEDAIGKRLRDDQQAYEVVGVVRNLKNGIEINQSVAYVPLTARDFARPPEGGITVMVRSDAGTDAPSAIRREIASIDPQLTIFNAQTLSDYLDRSRSSTRFSVSRYGGIGVFGLVLAAIGLAGVTAYGVAQRRKEIAIRTALGASRTQVLRLVLREGAALVSVGTILGFLGAVGMARALSALTNIFVDALRVGTKDPRLLVGAPLLLAIVAMLACYVPARRSLRIDPVKALREE